MQATIREKGFTLVELLIVVIILAILAAIVVPQFVGTTEDAGEAALDSNLSNIRSAIDLYAHQHGGIYPAQVAAGVCATGAGTLGAELIDTPESMLNQLAYYSNASGVVCTVKDDGGTLYPFGPYLNKPELPANPVTKNGAVLVVNTGSLQLAASGAGLGWRYDSVSGKFIANDSNLDASGVRYDQH